MEWMLNYNPRNRPKPNQVLAHAFFHPKTLGTEGKLSMKSPNVLSQDTTAESKKNPHLVESLTLGKESLQMQNRIINNKSTLVSDSKKLAEQTPSHQNKYKSIDYSEEQAAKASSVVVAGNSNFTPKGQQIS